MAASKYYVVWKGVEPGIYTTWKDTQRQVKGFPGAQFKSFPSREQAEAAYAGGRSSGPTRQPGNSSDNKGSTGKKTGGASSYALTSDVDIFCDGACDPNPGKAGTGIAVYRQQQLRQLWYGLYNPRGTNNSAELLGLHHSLLLAKVATEQSQSVTIHCDSRYSIDCITKWAFGWKSKGWKKSGGEIKNLDIIQQAHQLYTEISKQIEVVHVKGHAGVEGNELADRMSVVAIERKETALAQYTDAYTIADLLALNRG